MTRPSGPSEYSIASVSKLTGISCHTLRVWERRYGFPRPHRTAAGHRRYTGEQIQLLLSVVELVHKGQPISDLMTALHAGRIEPQAIVSSRAETMVEQAARELVDLLVSGDLDGGETSFRRLAQTCDPTELIVRVVEPALVDVGERWFRTECDVFQERAVSRFLRGKLEVLIEEARQANPHPSHTILAGTVQGDRHSGGVLILHLLLERRGWRVHNLGVDLPVREYEKAVALWRPDALGLSFVLSRNINKRFVELSKIRGVPVFVGGRSILNYQSLARRHGLFPVPGGITTAVGRLIDIHREWTDDPSTRG